MTKYLAVITPCVDTGGIALDAALAPFRVPGLSVQNFFLDDGPASIETEADVAECLPGLRRIARKIAAEGADAIIINCMCDPGLEELRASLNTVVLGPGQTSMHVAAILASRFSVLDVLTECRGDVEDQVRRYGLTQSYASHRALGIPVLELHNDHEHTLAALEREARAASDDDGAGALVLGCTGLADFADSLAQRLRAYGCRSLIIEPLRTTLGVARALLDGGLARPQSTAEQR